MKFNVDFKQVDDKKFYYFVPVRYGNKSKIWISSSFVKNENIIEFPMKNSTLVITQKGTKKIVKGDFIVVAVKIEGGYRGGVNIKIRTPNVNYWEVVEYRSPRGSLGEDILLFIEFPPTLEKVEIEYKKYGRLYGKSPRGVLVVYNDGKIMDIEELPEELSDLE